MCCFSTKELEARGTSPLPLRHSTTWLGIVEDISNIYRYFDSGLRPPEIDRAYKEHQRIARESNRPLKDCIQEELGDVRIGLLLNKYPYKNLFEKFNELHADLGLMIAHYNLWSVDGELSPEKVTELIPQLNPRFIDWRAYINRPKHQSIPDLWHTQVIGLEVIKDGALETGFQRLLATGLLAPHAILE